MMIKLMFFASIRETLGVATENITVPQHIQTIAQLRAFICQDKCNEVLMATDVLIALNHVMVDGTATIKNGDEVAFFPPVTGG